MSTLPQYTPYYGGGQVGNPSNVIRTSGPPSTKLTEDRIGTMAIDNAAGQGYILVSKSGGNNTWAQISGISANSFPVTPYVVGIMGQAGYQTIQAGINAANDDGGGIVVVQPGTYSENLTLISGVHVMGLVPTDTGGAVSIIGTHTPPSSGGVVLSQLNLQGSSSIISSASAGTTYLLLNDCTIQVSDGFTFDLVNWVGTLEAFNCDGTLGGQDGFSNNTGGAALRILESDVGAGTARIMVISGTDSVITGSNVICAITCISECDLECDNSFFSNTMTMVASTAGYITTCTFNTGSNSCIVTTGNMSNWSFINCVMQSSNTNTVAGGGANFNLTSIAFPMSFGVQSGVFPAWGTTTSGEVQIRGTKNLTMFGGKINMVGSASKINITSGSSVGTTSAMSGTPGSITVANTQVTSLSQIFVTRNTPGGTLGNISVPSASIVVGTSFVINSDANETSTFNYWVIN